MSRSETHSSASSSPRSSGATVSLRRLRRFREVVERGTDRVTDDIAAMTGFETDVDRFSFVPIIETPNHVAPGRRVGTVFYFDGPPSGYAVLLLSEQSAERVAAELLSGSVSATDGSARGSASSTQQSGSGSSVGDEAELGSLARSAVGEFGNVVTSGFVGGWADVFGIETERPHWRPDTGESADGIYFRFSSSPKRRNSHTIHPTGHAVSETQTWTDNADAAERVTVGGARTRFDERVEQSQGVGSERRVGKRRAVRSRRRVGSKQRTGAKRKVKSKQRTGANRTTERSNPTTGRTT